MDLRLCHRPLRLFPRPLRLSLQVPGLVLALKTSAVIQPRTVEFRDPSDENLPPLKHT